MTRARLGILVSGGGRTALNIATACADGTIDSEVALVVTHREEVAAVARCRAAGLRVAVVPDGPFLEDRLDASLVAARCDLVCLAGYLRKFRVGTRWAGRTLNIHPGLLPAFGGHGMYGDRVHAAVLEARATESGCTVHEVDEEYDRGAPILERRCAVEPGDTVASLGQRVFDLEREAYPAAIARFLAERTHVPAGGRA